MKYNIKMKCRDCGEELEVGDVAAYDEDGETLCEDCLDKYKERHT